MLRGGSHCSTGLGKGEGNSRACRKVWGARGVSLWSRALTRLKQIGRRWSATDALDMLATRLVYALHPERYAAVEATVRGEDRPQLSISSSRSLVALTLETARAS